METASAPCPRHPTATFTCARCGSFACEACRSSRAPCVVFGDQGTGRLILATVLSQCLNGIAMALLMTVLAHCYLRLSSRWLPSGEAR